LGSTVLFRLWDRWPVINFSAWLISSVVGSSSLIFSLIIQLCYQHCKVT